MDRTATFRDARRKLRSLTLGVVATSLLLMLVTHHASGAGAQSGVIVPMRMSDAPFSSSSVILIVIALAVDSIAGVVFSVTSATVRQAATPDHLMGPVMALNYTLCGSMTAVGTFAGGFIGSKLGPADAILIGCGMYVLAGLSAIGKPLGSITMYRQPFLQTFDRTFGAPHGPSAGDRVGILPSLRRVIPPAPTNGATRVVTCTRTGCTATLVSPCPYVDRAGTACGTQWCGDHSDNYLGTRVCQRHRRVLEGTGLRLEDRFSLPGTYNWAASLTLWVAGALDDDLMKALTQHYPADRGFDVTRRRATSEDNAGTRTWVSPWAVTYKGSTVVTGAVRVGENNDKLVIATINGREAIREVPPWISSRSDAAAQSRLDEANRKRFYERLVQRIVDALP